MGQYEDQLFTAYKAMSEDTRHKIVRLLLDRHHCSRSLAVTLGVSDSAVSQHMRVLKEAGVVTSYRHGYHVHYVLNRELLEKLVEQLQVWISKVDTIEDCHDGNSCQFKLSDGSLGCMYRSSE